MYWGRWDATQGQCRLLQKLGEKNIHLEEWVCSHHLAGGYVDTYSEVHSYRMLLWLRWAFGWRLAVDHILAHQCLGRIMSSSWSKAQKVL